MTEVQKTVNVTEVIQARIRMLKDQKQQYENDLAALLNNSKKIEENEITGPKFVYFAITGIVAIGVFLNAFKNSHRNVFFDVLLLIGIPVGLIVVLLYVYKEATLLAAKQNEEVQLVKNEKIRQSREVKKLLSETTKKIQEAEKQKQEILLSYDRELTAAQNDEIVGASENADMKECPACAEPVRARAKVCRYCGCKFETM